jgi:hypothetical protein
MSYEYWATVRERTGTSGNTITTEQATTGATRRRSGRERKARFEDGSNRPRPTLIQVFAGLVGATFALVGILGFIPGITTMYGELGLLGPDSQAELLGLFQVSVIHNLVHLGFGVGLLAARRVSTSKLFLLGGGALYVLVWLYGTVVNLDSDANFLPFNHADNVLHLGLALGMIALGVMGSIALRRSSLATAQR